MKNLKIGFCSELVLFAAYFIMFVLIALVSADGCFNALNVAMRPTMGLLAVCFSGMAGVVAWLCYTIYRDNIEDYERENARRNK